MPDDLVIARNPDPDSTLPYLIRIPLGEHGIVVKARETWPRTTKLYCHRPPAARRPPKGQESAIRAWARSRGLAVSARGRLSADLRRAWEQRDAE